MNRKPHMVITADSWVQARYCQVLQPPPTLLPTKSARKYLPRPSMQVATPQPQDDFYLYLSCLWCPCSFPHLGLGGPCMDSSFQAPLRPANSCRSETLCSALSSSPQPRESSRKSPSEPPPWGSNTWGHSPPVLITVGPCGSHRETAQYPGIF